MNQDMLWLIEAVITMCAAAIIVAIVVYWIEHFRNQ